MTQSEKAEFWQELINEQQKSGQSVAAFCRDWNLTECKFHYWKRRLKRLAEPNIQQTKFVELDFTEPPTISNSGITLRLNNLEIDLANNFDAECLRRVLDVAG